jgi:hypothetical protein
MFGSSRACEMRAKRVRNACGLCEMGNRQACEMCEMPVKASHSHACLVRTGEVSL